MSQTDFQTDHIVLPHDVPGSSNCSPLQEEAQVLSSSLRALTLHVSTNIAHGEFDGTNSHVSVSSITSAGLQAGFPEKHAFDATSARLYVRANLAVPCCSPSRCHCVQACCACRRLGSMLWLTQSQLVQALEQSAQRRRHLISMIA